MPRVPRTLPPRVPPADHQRCGSERSAIRFLLLRVQQVHEENNDETQAGQQGQSRSIRQKPVRLSKHGGCQEFTHPRGRLQQTERSPWKDGRLEIVQLVVEQFLVVRFHCDVIDDERRQAIAEPQEARGHEVAGKKEARKIVRGTVNPTRVIIFRHVFPASTF